MRGHSTVCGSSPGFAGTGSRNVALESKISERYLRPMFTVVYSQRPKMEGVAPGPVSADKRTRKTGCVQKITQLYEEGADSGPCHSTRGPEDTVLSQTRLPQKDKPHHATYVRPVESCNS